ncbi:AraC family transcriptional regulator ligand-binding domain-containing protein [Nocardioides flavescens]|uniref:AraC family transcriptional regulator ligand-binding domain-containing protein n=1 Tax=Nocardioides flavescens TaxID=2691959 RepID=UPI00136D4FD9
MGELLTRSPLGVSHLVAYAETLGVPAARVLAGSGLEGADLAVAGLEVAPAQELRVLANLMAVVGPDGGGELGRSYRLTTYGALGFAVLASRSVGEAVALALRFFDLSFAFVTPRVSLVDDRVVADLTGPAVPGGLRRFVVDRDVEAVRAALRELLPVGAVVERTAPGRRAAPSADARLTFDAALLALEPPTRRADLELCTRLCEELLDRRRAHTGLVAEARALVVQRLPDGAPMPDVAAGLGLSERTLRRRLEAAGTSYRTLLDEVRSGLAAVLLEAGLGAAEVSARLGYAEPAAFSHARTRWRTRADPA